MFAIRMPTVPSAWVHQWENQGHWMQPSILCSFCTWCKWRNHGDFSRITSMGSSLEEGGLIASPASLGQVEPCVGCFMSWEGCVTSDRHHLKPPGSQPRCFGAKAWSTGRKWQGVETHRPSSWTFPSDSQSVVTARDEERVVAREG